MIIFLKARLFTLWLSPGTTEKLRLNCESTLSSEAGLLSLRFQWHLLQLSPTLKAPRGLEQVVDVEQRTVDKKKGYRCGNSANPLAFRSQNRSSPFAAPGFNLTEWGQSQQPQVSFCTNPHLLPPVGVGWPFGGASVYNHYAGISCHHVYICVTGL